MKTMFFAPPLLALLLTACGGGGADALAEIESLREQAAAKEKEARALGVDIPCSVNLQCGGLAFASTVSACGAFAYKPYSLVSSSAKLAETAAAAQRQLAASLVALLPPEPCPAAPSQLPPGFSCVVSICIQTP